MVCDWKPNSSRDLNGPRIPDGGPSVPDHSDDSGPENEIIPAEFGHYQLLPSDMQEGLDHIPQHANDSSDSDEDSGDTGDEVDPDPSNVLPEAPLTDIDHNSQHVLEGWEKSEIRLDCEKIRSLMRGFSLPESAVPEWASAVPESAFTSFVQQRMKPNQNKNE